MISDHLHNKIERMTSGDSLMMLGNLWFGEDDQTTVSNIYTFGNKGIDMVRGIRMESAIAMSTSGRITDSIQIELTVNYSRFRSHIQRLFALIQVTPVIPVMNPLAVCLLMPIELNLLQYVAYGLVDPQFLEKRDLYTKESLMRIYSSIPIQCCVDNIRLSSQREISRDVTLLVTLSRVSTANSYGDVVKYVKTLDDAITQEKILRKLFEMGGDSKQTDVFSHMFGSKIEDIRDMMNSMMMENTIAGTTVVTAKMYLTETIDGSRIALTRTDSIGSGDKTQVNRKLRGIKVPPTEYTLRLNPVADTILSQIDANTILAIKEAATLCSKELSAIIKEKGETPLVTVNFMGKSEEINTELIASVSFQDGTDPGYRMVENGFAVVVESEFKDSEIKVKEKYLSAQDKAKKYKRGLWGLTPEYMEVVEEGNLWKLTQIGKRNGKANAPIIDRR